MALRLSGATLVTDMWVVGFVGLTMLLLPGFIMRLVIMVAGVGG